MALEYEDRVQDQTTTTGTGTLTVSGIAPTGYRTFASAHATGVTVQYTCLTSDFTEWEVGQGVWTSAGSTLTRLAVYASSNAGALVSFSAGTKVVFTGPVAADIGPLMPLMDLGGMNFNGTTTYLDTNALTGITDTKKGTIVLFIRFGIAAVDFEDVIEISGNRFRVIRDSTGFLTIEGRNAAGTLILQLYSASALFLSAGNYAVMASWDLATAGSGRYYVNDVSSVVEGTFTNDTIDYTVTEWSIGRTSDAATFFVTGDIYSIWFTELTNIDFNVVVNRRKFFDANNVPVPLGSRGELPTGTPPILFLGNNDGANFSTNRGLATSTFTENGAIADATTALYGAYFAVDAVARAVTKITAVGNVTTGEDNLMTYSMPANTLNAVRKGIHITAWGTTANNANAKTLKLYFGSAVILTNALTVSIAGFWRLEADVISTGTDAQKYVAQLVTTGTAGVALNDIEIGTATQDDGAAITIKCTGEATATNDIVQEGLIVTVIGA